MKKLDLLIVISACSGIEEVRLNELNQGITEGEVENARQTVHYLSLDEYKEAVSETKTAHLLAIHFYGIILRARLTEEKLIFQSNKTLSYQI